MHKRNVAMRKITALAALLIAVFSLAGCKNSNDEEYQRPRNIETPAIYNEMPPKGSIGS
jgi:nitrous oxide reductase accessory protein NosL